MGDGNPAAGTVHDARDRDRCGRYVRLHGVSSELAAHRHAALSRAELQGVPRSASTTIEAPRKWDCSGATQGAPGGQSDFCVSVWSAFTSTILSPVRKSA